MKITSLNNPLVKHFVKLREKKQYREEHHSVLVASKKLIDEISKEVSPKRILQEATPQVFKKITNQPSPEGIVAEFPLPEPSSLEGLDWVLVLDRVTDPGNMGSLLRTALALGWQGVLFLPGCVDPFCEKVISASRGALFFLPFCFGELHIALPLVIADTKGKPLSPLKRCALVLGNEANGVSPDIEGEKICIPQKGQMESLNVAVAGGIMMYGLKNA